jgi:hypothetical protein
LTIVEDPYGDANVCGDAINLASRIMDTAAPGQILASSASVVPNLKEFLDNSNQNWSYDISPESSEIVVKHGVTTHVHSIMCTIGHFPDRDAERENSLSELRQSIDLLDNRVSVEERTGSYQDDLPDWKEMSFATLSSSYTKPSISPSSRRNESFRTRTLSNSITEPGHLSQSVGSHDIPKSKWYLKIKPTEMQSDANHIKPKILPQELIQRHKRIAFVGITHDNLYKVFKQALEADPTHTWDQVYIFYPSDGCLHALASNLVQSGDELITLKNASTQTLLDNLSAAVKDLRLLELNQLMHCGSYWDWKDQGGYIHISPLTWGADPKTCPAMNYYWNSTDPSPEYRVYRDGLDYLLNIATPLEP